MAYERQTWECGETITAEKLNHMEEGISSASGGGTPLLATITIGEELELSIDKTYEEMVNALINGNPINVVLRRVTLYGEEVETIDQSNLLYAYYNAPDNEVSFDFEVAGQTASVLFDSNGNLSISYS